MINQSRRKLLKGITYGSAIVAGGGLTSVAFALSSKKEKITKVANTGAALPTCDITIMQQQSSGKEVITLMNLTDKTVTLDSIQPVGLEHVNGSLVVKVNAIPTDGTVAMLPGERFTFEVEAISANLINEKDPIPNVLAGHLQINSEHPAFNGIIPVTVFDSQLA